MYRSKLVQAQTLVNPLPARVVELATTERFPVPRPSNFRLCLSVLAMLGGLWITIWLVHKVSWNYRSKITFRGHSDSVFDEEEANFLPIPEVADPVLRTIIRRYTSVGVFFLASLAFTLPLLLASLSEGTFWPIAEIRQTYLRAFGDRISFSVLGPLIVVLACRLCTAIGCVYIRLQNEFDVDKKAIDNEAKRFSKIGVPLAGAIGAVLAFVFLCLKWKSFRMYGIPPAPSGLFLAASLCIIIFIFFSSLVRWWMFSDSLASLLRNVTPNPLHADGHCGLRFIGDVCIDFFLLLAAGGVCLVVLAVQDQLLHRAPGIELIFILPWIVGSTILVILPIYHTHRIIVRERRNRLDDCSLRLSRHTMYDEELEKLRAEHEALRSSSRWPINVSAASAVLAAVILQTILPSILKRWIG